MLNRKSDFFVIVIATYNRLAFLKKTIDSIKNQTTKPYEIIVADGGSTDGTIGFLKNRKDITSVFQGELLGVAKANNLVWREIQCKYTCWLSDDTIVVNRSLDLALEILEKEPDIGLVGLKMRDVVGNSRPLVGYGGGISQFGILNCNHAVMPFSVLKSVGFFNEDYRSYGVDPDLTASILCLGKKVVMTKKIGVLHFRPYAQHENVKEHVRKSNDGISPESIYREKFSFLQTKGNADFCFKVKRKLLFFLGNLLSRGGKQKGMKFLMRQRDWRNISHCQFMTMFELFLNSKKPYHLAQKIPRSLLKSDSNPYIHFVK